jgi:uncharacterized protein (DUF983 family)
MAHRSARALHESQAEYLTVDMTAATVMRAQTPAANTRDVWQAMKHGFACRCPACGEGQLFEGYLTVRDACPVCHEEMHHQRADDAPPYFTIFITGHIVVPLMFMVDRMGEPPIWLMSAIFVPLTIGLVMALIQPVKGGTVGLMLTLNMLKNEPPGTASRQ